MRPVATRSVLFLLMSGGVLAGALVVAGALSRDADAHAPHPGLDFSIGADVNGDGVDDCSTRGGEISCQAASGTLLLTVYLDDLGNIEEYTKVYMSLDLDGVAFKQSSSSGTTPTVTWPDCDHEQSGWWGVLNFGCLNGDSPGSSYLGSVGKVTLHCIGTPQATVMLVAATGDYGTNVRDVSGSDHAEQGGRDALTIHCGATPTRIPTRTPTPSPTPCAPSCPPLNFAIGIDMDGDGTNDCGTGVPLAVGDGAPDDVPVEVTNTSCVAEGDAVLAVRSYLMGSGGMAYEAAASHVYYSGVESKGAGSSVWRCAIFQAPASGENYENAGAAIGISAPCNVAQTSLGLMNEFTFTCTQGGAIALGHGLHETLLISDDNAEHREAGPDKLSVRCGDRTPVPTFTPSATLTATWTPDPNWTPTPPVPTPCHGDSCPSPQFAIGVDLNSDGMNDCGSGVPRNVGDGAPDAVPIEVMNTACSALLGSALAVNVYLIDNDGVTYEAQASSVRYSGVVSKGRGDAVWEGCTFEATAPETSGFENAGCTIGEPPAQPVDHVGLMTRFSFTCSANGTISLDHGSAETLLWVGQPGVGELRERNGSDLVTVNCGVEGPPAIAAGDSNCDGAVDSIDAAIILQNVAGLLQSVPCAEGADADDNGTINAIDAALVLQFTAGLKSALG